MDTDKIGTMAQLIVHSHNHRSDRLGPKWRGSDNQTIAKRVAIWPHLGGYRSPAPGTIKRIYCRGKGVSSSTECYCLCLTQHNWGARCKWYRVLQLYKERRVHRIRQRDVCRLLRERAEEIRSRVKLNWTTSFCWTWSFYQILELYVL